MLIIEDILEGEGKSETNIIILGDWNIAVADKSYRNIVGPQGLGKRNQSGQMVVEFSDRRN
jgi:exonuclease III